MNVHCEGISKSGSIKFEGEPEKDFYGNIEVPLKKVGGLILYHQGKDILFGNNPLLECWNKVDIAFKKFKKEKEKLSLI